MSEKKMLQLSLVMVLEAVALEYMAPLVWTILVTFMVTSLYHHLAGKD